MQEVEVTMTINYPEGVTGERLIEVVQTLAGRGYRQSLKAVNEQRFYSIGRSSNHPAEDVLIKVLDNTEINPYIDPAATYHYIMVVYHEWPGEKYAVGYTDEAVIRKVRQFRDELQTALDAG